MLSDTDPMPYGKFKGIPMGNVPAWYLLWLYKVHRTTTDVRIYVLTNMDILQKEFDNEPKKEDL